MSDACVVALSALVREGLIDPRQADIAYCQLAAPRVALCAGCGRITKNVETRLHVGCERRPG